MPDITPLYRSTQLPTARPGSPGLRSPSLQNAPDVSSGGKALAGAMGDTAGIFKGLHDAHERTALNEAKVESLKEISDFKNSLIERTDYQNFEPEYKTFITELPEKYKERFKDNDTWKNFMLDFKRQAIMTGASISVITRKQQIDYGRASLKKNQTDLELSLKPYDNPKARQAIIDQYRTLIEDNVTSGYLSREEAENDITAFLGRADLNQAMFDMKTRPGSFDASNYKYMSEKTKMQLEDQAKRIHEAKNKEMQVIKDRLIKEESIRIKTTIKDDLAMIETTGEGMPGLVTEAQGVFSDAEFEGYLKARGRAQKIYNTWNIIRFQNPQDAAKTLEELKPKGGPGYADDLQDYQRITSNYSQAMQALLNDPHAYATMAPGVDSIDKSLAFQERMGVPEYRQRVMTDVEAGERVAQMNALSPEDRIKATESLSQEYGRHWDIAYTQMVEKGLPAESQIITSVVNQPVILKDVANAATAGEKEIKDAIGNPGKIKITEESVKDILSDYEETIRRSGLCAETMGMMNDVRGVINNTALYRISKGMDPENAAQETVNDIILNKYHDIEDSGPLKYVRVPIEADNDLTENKAEYILDNIEKHNIDLPDKWPVVIEGSEKEFETFYFGTTQSQEEAYIRKIKEEAYWANRSDEKGLMLMINGVPVLNKNGQLIWFMFPMTGTQ